jgi:hypothetical protein
MGRTDFGANPWGKEGSGEYHRIRTGVRWGELADEPLHGEIIEALAL